MINLLEKICKKYNINFVNPTNVLENFSQDQDQVMESDLGHYTELGIVEFSKYMNNYIKSIL